LFARATTQIAASRADFTVCFERQSAFTANRRFKKVSPGGEHARNKRDAVPGRSRF
jgi:hypothetical protein